MSTILNARSPHFVTIDATNLASVEMDVTIYTGDKNSPPNPSIPSPQYTLQKSVIGSNDFVTFELSELVRDYFAINYGTSVTDAVWLKMDITKTFDDTSISTLTAYRLCFEGFGFFEEEVNPRSSTSPLVSSHMLMCPITVSSSHYFVRGRRIRIPVFSEPAPNSPALHPSNPFPKDFKTEYWSNDALTSGVGSITATDSDDTDDKAQYFIIDSTNLDDGESHTLTSTSGSLQARTFNFIEICEPRYEKYRVVFQNKHGFLQDIWFTKKSIIQDNFRSESYKANIMSYTSSPSYSTTQHQDQRFNTNGKQQITLNTPFYPETFNLMFRELLLSEQVWIEDENEDVFPVKILTSNFVEKTGVNDKLIQYTMDFEFSNDMINNVR